MISQALPLTFADVQLSTGARLRYAEHGDPAGAPLILLHGYTDSWFSWSRVLPALAASYHCYALDQRGHGDSDRPADGYGMPDFAADVLAFMDAVGLARATIVGHSMGTFVAQELALAAPGRVSRLVLIGASATPSHMNDVREFRQAVDVLDESGLQTFATEFQLSTIYHAVPDAFVARAVEESIKLPPPVWRAVLAGFLTADYAGRLGEIRAPALLLWGDRDAIFSREEQDVLLRGLPDATLRVYQETGHAVQWERPEQVVRDVDDFIARTGARD